MKDMVTITCNGDTEQWERNKALEFFSECVRGCDGHEKLRYMYIVECLECGDTDINDDEVQAVHSEG